MKALPYLERVIKESMRMNPPVSWIGRRLVNDMKIVDTTAPAVTMVCFPGTSEGRALNVQRYGVKQVYHNPLKFNPDRLLPENAAKRHPYHYIPFSAGPRNCIGQKFAIYLEKVVISWILRRFKISSDMPFHDNGRCTEVVLRPEYGIPIKLERRS